MPVCLMPQLLKKIQGVFRPVEIRRGTPTPSSPVYLSFSKELSGHPRFCGALMGAEVLWTFNVLDKASSKPKDADFTAEYILDGRNITVFGRNNRYLEYPVNVFLNVCMI